MADASYGREYAGIPQLKWFRAVEHEYVELRDDGAVLYVIPRGTDSVNPVGADWRRNLRVTFSTPGQMLQQYDGLHHYQHATAGRVHTGFAKGTAILLPHVRSVLKRNPQRPLVFIGHSAGAAEACLLAAIFHREGRNVQHVITFGCPNFCDKAWSKHTAGIDTTHYVAGRWVPFWRDPVAHYPIRMRRNGTTVYWPGRPGVIRNHSMQNYINLAEKTV